MPPYLPVLRDLGPVDYLFYISIMVPSVLSAVGSLLMIISTAISPKVGAVPSKPTKKY
jgi:hypothetical protein